MYILSIASPIKKMSFHKIRDFIFKSYYKRIAFSKQNNYYSMKHYKNDLQLLAIKPTEKPPDPRNAKEHYQLFITKKNTKSVWESKLFTRQPKAFENSNIIDIKSCIIEHPKALKNRLCQT